MTTTMQEPKLTKSQIAKVTVLMRVATVDDFRVEVYNENGAVVERKYKPKYGQQYWEKSLRTGKFDNRNYTITENTDWEHVKLLLKYDCIYVPVSQIDLEEAGLWEETQNSIS